MNAQTHTFEASSTTFIPLGMTEILLPFIFRRTAYFSVQVLHPLRNFFAFYFSGIRVDFSRFALYFGGI
jgi:hypothetical protein